jgi:PLP dependent protein
MKPATENIAQTLACVRAKISAICKAVRRDPLAVAIVAVTKGFGPGEIQSALAAGLFDVGENYYQEAAAKFDQIKWPLGARRHFIGRVQRNKARRIAALFDMVQTVDNLETAEALHRGAADMGKVLDVLVQANTAGDHRQGVVPDLLVEFAREVDRHPNLRVRGLMVMGPNDKMATPSAFARAAESFDQLRRRMHSINILSMGMSDDMEIALEHGSTMLRLGTALFGSRPRSR